VEILDREIAGRRACEEVRTRVDRIERAVANGRDARRREVPSLSRSPSSPATMGTSQAAEAANASATASTPSRYASRSTPASASLSPLLPEQRGDAHPARRGGRDLIEARAQ
jgi:hypothetical protein